MFTKCSEGFNGVFVLLLQVTDAMKNIPVRMISYGGSNYNISFLIKEEDKQRALQSLSDKLFNS